jgi:hypothetical protein
MLKFKNSDWTTFPSTLCLDPYQIFEIQTRFRQHVGMYVSTLHTLFPRIAVFGNTTELPFEDTIEIVHMFLCPFDASGHHGHGKAALVDERSVFDNGEVDEGDLVDVEMEVSFENALSEEE